MRAVEFGPVPLSERTQSAFDLFLIFAGANIVATTLQVGAALAPDYPPRLAMALIVAGTVLGSALVAVLAPIGPRLGVPSVVAARAVLGLRGAAAVALLLYLTNFAWIAINNQIAASVSAQAVGHPGAARLLNGLLGVMATAIVAGGPRAVGRADRVAVPVMLLVGVLLTAALITRVPTPGGSVGPASAPLLRGLDVVIGYQVSWILMFADYSRYTRSARRGAVAVFLGLAVMSAWFIPIGFYAARAAGSSDPGAMLAATGIGWWGALLVTLATVTTNFVNIYLSSLALKSLWPRVGDQFAVWSIGLAGTALGLSSNAWLGRYADLMLVLGALLVPVGGILLAHYFLLDRSTRVDDLYDSSGPYARRGGFSTAGVTAWVVGSATYFVASPIGSTLPALLAAVVTYAALARRA
ncbi:MAG: CytX-like hydroxymethylpyrimidine transporter protein [Acidobacteria bacterium]|jgi:purine-cytosine permease-like protein|nr:CytX-like hydroxymethylpyrimidine transporter protein [Acidobacteriota bacterium]